MPNCRIGNAMAQNLDQGFDDAARGLEPVRECGRRFLERGAVGVQPRRRNFSRAQHRKHRVEIGARRVAAAEQRRLALVELGIGEGDLAEHDADEHIGAAVRDIEKARVHRLGGARAIEHAIEEVARGERAEPLARVRARASRHDRRRSHRAQKSSRSCARVEHRHLGAARLGEDRAGDADRPGADDQNSLPGCDFAASHGMGADGEEFRHRGLVETDAARVDEIVVGDAEPVRHAAVAVDAEHIELLAAIGLAAPARDAVRRNAR